MKNFVYWVGVVVLSLWALVCISAVVLALMVRWIDRDEEKADVVDIRGRAPNGAPRG